MWLPSGSSREAGHARSPSGVAVDDAFAGLGRATRRAVWEAGSQELGCVGELHQLDMYGARTESEQNGLEVRKGVAGIGPAEIGSGRKSVPKLMRRSKLRPRRPPRPR